MRYKRSTLLLLWTWSLVRVIKIFSARCFSVVCPGVHAHMYHVFTRHYRVCVKKVDLTLPGTAD